jgi:hypothetical protein
MGSERPSTVAYFVAEIDTAPGPACGARCFSSSTRCPGVVLDRGHERPHQHHAAAAGGTRAVRHAVQSGTLRGRIPTLVGDLDAGHLRCHRARDVHLLGRVELVAMHDRVDDRLLDGQMDAKMSVGGQPWRRAARAVPRSRAGSRHARSADRPPGSTRRTSRLGTSRGIVCHDDGSIPWPLCRQKAEIASASSPRMSNTLLSFVIWKTSRISGPDVAHLQPALGGLHLAIERDQLAQRGTREKLDIGEVEQDALAVELLDEPEELRAELLDAGLVEDLLVDELHDRDLSDLRDVDRRWAVMRQSLGGERRGSERLKLVRAALAVASAIRAMHRVAARVCQLRGREPCCRLAAASGSMPRAQGRTQAWAQAGPCPGIFALKTAAAPIPASPARQLLP